ncbi:dienelactone hydrolase family protein [Bryobacter aggregatus]|uniref:dienelactone hydrolase family protein n=1 Tax=Bryobacter aggregatus TaxID=360054 RepID=UPI0004E10C4A|nr:dienelactone hydrolase family protein [Bryobacter aggregatus]
MHEDLKSELNSLVPDPENHSRRGFLVTTLPVGFALAVQPVSAQTITTNTDGITAGEVKVPVQDGEMPAYRAFPNKGSNFPVVLVIQEIFGVHEHIKDLCRRLAKKGYYAIAPALFARQGDPSTIENVQNLIRDIVSKVPDAQVMADLDATLAFAGKHEGNEKKAAITGYCWGGRIVWLYASHNPKIKAGAAWYGRMEGQGTPLQPTQPIEIAVSLKVPILGLYGGKDQGIPQSSVEKMRVELAKGKSKSEIILYGNAQHGFNADYRPSYGKVDAEDAWARMLAWFKSHGVK